jgi:phosphatidylethanolamine-binding protein (PEBP) family uncharacterized protein
LAALRPETRSEDDMNPSKLIKLAVTGFSLALILTGCGSSTGDGTGTGGSSATGGTTGTGGTATGGITGTGGTATGGITGTGGTATGGITGTGGTATGGITGTGGTAGAGGKAGSNGAGGSAGAAGHPAGGAAGGAGHPAGGATGTGGSGGASGAMTLTSPDQADGAHFSSMFTCAANNGAFGSGVNPELDWGGVPTGTMSFAMTFIDTKIGANMPMGQHWAIWDIPAAVREFPKGTTTLTGDLAGAMQTNTYLAPCPSGNDTYEYTLYALSSATLSVTGASGSATSNSAGVAKVLAALANVTPLATATLHGTSMAMGK